MCQKVFDIVLLRTRGSWTFCLICVALLGVSTANKESISSLEGGGKDAIHNFQAIVNNVQKLRAYQSDNMSDIADGSFLLKLSGTGFLTLKDSIIKLTTSPKECRIDEKELEIVLIVSDYVLLARYPVTTNHTDYYLCMFSRHNPTAVSRHLGPKSHIHK